MSTILLGTVAIEPNRWGGIDPGWGPTIQVSDWLPAIAEAGFDGIELWEKHLTEADDDEVEKVLGSGVPVSVFNSYVSFDLEEPDFRSLAADWVARSGATGVKYNVGNNSDREDLYVERVSAWLAEMPDDVRLLCECHVGISIAEEPTVAARIFDAVGPINRVKAIVHSNEDHDHVRARFDAYGDRIGHIHVNHLDFEKGGPPRLATIRSEFESTVALLRVLGFDGSWTVEFVHGTLSENDNPGYLFERAAEDLVVLRELLD